MAGRWVHRVIELRLRGAVSAHSAAAHSATVHFAADTSTSDASPSDASPSDAGPSKLCGRSTSHGDARQGLPRHHCANDNETRKPNATRPADDGSGNRE